jgi:hypothetical protein
VISGLLLHELPRPLAIAGGILCVAGVAVSRTGPRTAARA